MFWLKFLFECAGCVAPERERLSRRHQSPSASHASQEPAGVPAAASMSHAGACMGVGDARVIVDDQEIDRIAGGRVGLFRDIAYADFPVESENSHGGRMER